MIRPTALTIEGFRSFKEKTTITFPALGSTLISGQYADSAMSSGSGKSSILMAISYALGFCSLPATELKNWESDKMSVSLILDTHLGPVKISRTPQLKVIATGQDKVYSGKDGTEFLNALFKAEPDILKILTYRAQKEPGAFLGSANSDKHDFLMSLLGLKELEQAQDLFNKTLSSIEMNRAMLLNSVASKKQVLPSLQVDKDQYLKAKNDCDTAFVQLNALNSDLNSPKSDYLRQQAAQYQQALSDNRAMQTKVAVTQSQEWSLRNNLTVLDSEISKLQSHTCPTCSRHWAENGQMLEEKLRTVEAIKAKIAEGEAVQRHLPQLKAAELQFNEALVDLNRQLSELNRPKAEAERVLSATQSLLNELTKKIQQSIQLQQTIEIEEKKIEALNEELKLANLASSLLGRDGFLSVIFDELLAELERQINTLIAKVPNVSRYVARVRSASLSKTGNVKKNISISLTKDGKEVSVKSLSGGQLCALDLCVDLSLIEIVKRRTGSEIGWLMLDEAMDGLDVENKRYALDMVRELSRGVLILVDHATEIKDSFESIVEVRYDGRHSSVV